VNARTFSALLAVSLAAGCASNLVFADKPIVWEVGDDANIAEPEEIAYVLQANYMQTLVMDPVDRTLSIPDESRAQDINALDEVPDSTWWENRIGRYDLTPEDVARGPGGSPPKLPLTLTKGKTTGSNPGIFATDASGRKFLIKFDIVREMHTGNTAVGSRLFWAMGYHVPKEHVFTFTKADLRIGPGATYDEGLEEDLPMTWKQVDQLLDQAPTARAGELRALGSELLAGKPKGGFSATGRRKDDPNDVIDHEHRRSLRGLKVFSIWLDHSDMGEHNSLDMYVEDGNRRYLKHYLIDFGETLGAHAINRRWVGYQHVFDFEYQFGSLFTFGLWKRPWEDFRDLPYPSVGPYYPDLDPRLWKEKRAYYPFREMTEADAFWAAKIVMRFSREHVAAAVAAGQFSSGAAERYLVDTIMARRRSIGLAYMTTVTALDRFDVEPDRLCMLDLAVHHGLAFGGDVEVLRDGDVVETRAVPDGGKVCVQGPGSSDYIAYDLRVRRGKETLPGVEVHVRGGKRPRVVGVARDW